ncbi:tRNA-splicing endonuclease subunit Sen34 [Drosophila obscura]|uniref:tRNA-splicing endonuclease subunit Sen34 n=1 Tax=Drosophila obscura TaxID=7282 RepID=UPI000BA02C24|nr:tRNA-splicing endonuclease subunit Sen34 [Drosophila obscura]XP_022211317.1 tRNA-splicing endonuclease subunit Sen34 [Drosophila obscura]
MYLTLLNGTGYVFSVDDYMELRTKHRLMGALVGTANTKGWCPDQSTLPVELTKFETQLILDEGLALLVNKSKAFSASPTPKELTEYRSDLDERLEGQADALKAEKLRETERYMEKILLGKRNKLLKQGLATKAAALVGDDVLKEVADNFKFDLQNALVEVPCEHLSKHTAQIVPGPLVDTGCIRYRIFRDLWLRGKFVTSGEAFGADFLVYPGDPLIYHASHIVIVQNTSLIRPLDWIAKVRLSVIVNKSCMFAYEKRGEGITYQTVAWCNPSK